MNREQPAGKHGAEEGSCRNCGEQRCGDFGLVREAKPVREVNNHSREETRLSNSQKKACDIELINCLYEPGQNRDHGQNNLQAFSDEMEDEGNNSADGPVDDPAIEQARRRARIQYLRARIDGLEVDALSQDGEINDLEHMGDRKGKENGITKVMDALGNAVSVSPRLQALKDREEASRLRDELAGLAREDQVTACAPVP